MPSHNHNLAVLTREGEESDTITATSPRGVARTSPKTAGSKTAGKAAGLSFRRPTHQDGAAMWTLTKDTGVLDLNSPYAYLMMGEWFPDTCVVAEENGRLAGFVIGFVSSVQPDAIFVWQVGVDGSMRGRGLGKKLLDAFFDGAPEGVRYLEATVTPSNAPSEALFRSWAKSRGVAVEISEKFAADAFPTEGHEAERLFRIGPVDRASS